MNCKKCGKENNSSNKFCIYCGEALFDEKAVELTGNPPVLQGTVQNAPEQNFQQPSNRQSIQTLSNKKIKPVLIAAIAAAALVIFAVIVIAVVNALTVNPAKYINTKDISYDGVNGFATVESNQFFDYKGFVEDIGGSTKKTGDEFFDGLLEWGNGALYAQSVSVDIDSNGKSEGLSNGDTITVVITIDKDGINDLSPKKKIIGKRQFTRKIKVSGIKEPIMFNPFLAIATVSYDTTSGVNYTTVEFNKSFSKKLGDYKAVYNKDSFEYGITLVDSSDKAVASIGFNTDDSKFESDKVIAVSTSCKKADLQKFGIILEQTSKNIKPETVSYLNSVKQLGKSDFNAIKDRAMKIAKEYYSGAVYKGAYFASGKTDYYNNALYIVYSYKDTILNETVYATLVFQNLKINSKGKITNLDVNAYSGYYSSKQSAVESFIKSEWKNTVKITD